MKAIKRKAMTIVKKTRRAISAIVKAEGRCIMFKESWRIILWISRKLIDALDSTLMNLLSWRMEICKLIGRTKIRHNLPIHVPEREKELLKKRQRQAKKFGFSEKAMRILAKAVMSESKRIQSELKRA